MFSAKGRFAVFFYSYHMSVIVKCLLLQACSVDQRNIEALLLHGMVLTSMKKYTDAILQFRKANDVRNILCL